MGPINFRVDVHVEGSNPNAPDPILTSKEWGIDGYHIQLKSSPPESLEWKAAMLIFPNVHEAYSYIEDLRKRWNIRSAIVVPTPNAANARFLSGGLREFKKEEDHAEQ